MKTGRESRAGFVTRFLGTAGAGAVGWAIDAAVLWALARVFGVPVALAAALGFSISAIANFLLNRLVHDGSKNPVSGQAVRYSVLFGVNLILTTVTVPLVTNTLTFVPDGGGIRLMVAKALVTIVLLALNSLVYHFWVFRAPSGDAGDAIEGGKPL